MDDTKVYEFVIKLNTYLKRQKILSEKMLKQEQKLAKIVLYAQNVLPPDEFRRLVSPMIETLEQRMEVLKQFTEASDDFVKIINEFQAENKGIIL